MKMQAAVSAELAGQNRNHFLDRAMHFEGICVCATEGFMGERIIARFLRRRLESIWYRGK